MCSAERYSDADWDVIESFFPEDWNEKARELGATKRDKAFKTPAKLLGTLLIHVGEGAWFRDTSLRAKEGGLASMSDVALLKALRRSGPWLHWLAQAVMQKWLASRRIPAPDGISRVRVVDGTTIQRPGATGATWGVYSSVELPSMLCDEVCITGPETGESLRLFDVRPGDLVMGDRGLAHRSGIHHVVSHGGDVLVRISRTSIPLYDKQGRRFDVLGHLHATDPASAKAWLHGKLLIAFLVEALKIAGTRFVPWGYPIRAEER